MKSCGIGMFIAFPGYLDVRVYCTKSNEDASFHVMYNTHSCVRKLQPVSLLTAWSLVILA